VKMNERMERIYKAVLIISKVSLLIVAVFDLYKTLNKIHQKRA